jgi:hypothetical protein
LFVRPAFGGTLGQYEGDVGLTSYANGQLLVRNETSGKWVNNTLTAGTGVSVTNGAGSITITNTAPDQTVALTAGTGISVSGTYPNFTVTNTSPSSGGTVTSVTGTSPIVSSGGNTPAISLASGYGDTQNPYASKTANYVLASPNGSSGVPTFRAIVAADIPTLNQNTTGSAATVTTTINSGVVATTQASGDNSTKVATTAYVNAVTGTSGINGFKNRIINGAMMIDQRNAGASVTPANLQYIVDRWQAQLTQNSKFTVQQNAGSVTPPIGYSKYLGVTSSSAYSVLTGDYFALVQGIEGLNTADLAWGTASAATVTLSFWVRSSLTGTFGGAIAGGPQSYPFTYTILSANTWEQKSITIAGSTSGSWATNNTASMYVSFNLGTGTTYSGTSGAWSNNFYFSATGATSVVGTNGATFYVTGVQLEKGSTATSFDYRPYGTELALCYRYLPWHLLSSGTVCVLGQAVSTSTAYYTLPFQVAARANPTGITLTTGSLSAGNSVFGNAGGTGVFNSGQTTQGQIVVGGASGLVAGNASYLYPSATMTVLWNGCEL